MSKLQLLLLTFLVILAASNSSAELQDVDKKLGEILETALDILNQTFTALAQYRHEEQQNMLNITDRLRRLEDRVTSTCPQGNQTFESLENRVEKLEGSIVSRAASENSVCPEENKPVLCESGMNTTVEEAFVLLTQTNLDRQIRCDAQTDGGGWIVFQRRALGDVDFYRNWTEYRDGFGSLTGDFWLGNEALHKLTNEDTYELRIDFVADGEAFYAEYTTFLIENETNLYKLHLGAYAGGNVEEMPGSGMSHSDLGPFSTFDRDNDSYSTVNCAVSGHGAWWYRQCSAVNLNGEWGIKNPRGMRWYNGKVHRYATFVEMKVRRVN